MFRVRIEDTHGVAFDEVDRSHLSFSKAMRSAEAAVYQQVKRYCLEFEDMARHLRMTEDYLERRIQELAMTLRMEHYGKGIPKAENRKVASAETMALALTGNQDVAEMLEDWKRTIRHEAVWEAYALLDDSNCKTRVQKLADRIWKGKDECQKNLGSGSTS